MENKNPETGHFTGNFRLFQKKLKFLKNFLKKVLTFGVTCGIIIKQSRGSDKLRD